MKNIIIVFIVVYVLIGLLLYVFQKSLLYHPNKQDFYTCQAFKEYKKKTFNGTRFYYKQGNNETVIIHYHGNAGSTCDRSFTRPMFEQFDASIIYVEYAGYSNDTVRPSKKRILKDVKNIHNFVMQENYTNIIVYGQSLGSAAASYQAYLGNVNHLILVTPFSTLQELAQSMFKIYPASLILTEKFDNIKWLKEYENNLIIIHGDKDKIIPPKFSKILYNKVSNKNKEFVLIQGSGHNDIWRHSEFQQTLTSFLDKAVNK